MLRIISSNLIIALCLGFSACYSENVVHAYMIVKTNPEYSHVHDWRPVIQVTYSINGDEVISKLAGLVEVYKGCEIINIGNWECHYTDGTGFNKFGFSDRKYWKIPASDENVKYVSRWKYNVIRCKWYLHYNGVYKGILSCLKTYI